MERAWPSGVDVVCIASTRLTCCDVVLALWIEHGGGMTVVRFGGGDREDQVEVGGLEEGWRKLDGEQGPKVIAGGSTQSPWLRSRNTHIIEGEGTVLSEGDVVASRQVVQAEMEEALVGERKDRNEDGADVRFGDDSGRDGSEIWENRQAVEATKNAEQIDYTTVLCKHSRCARQLRQDE
jgi:hypothetical protein